MITEDYLRAKARGAVANGRFRALKVNTICTLTIDEWEAVVIASDGICALCGEEVGLAAITLDHIHPRAFGGAHCLSNVQAVCLPCNITKNDFPPSLREKGWIPIREAARMLGDYTVKIKKTFLYHQNERCADYPTAIRLSDVRNALEKFSGMNLSQFAALVNKELKARGASSLSMPGVRYRLHQLIISENPPLALKWEDVQVEINEHSYWDIPREHAAILAEAVINFSPKPYDEREGLGNPTGNKGKRINQPKRKPPA